MKPRLLSRDEYFAAFLKPVRDVTLTATDVLDIWPYVAAIPSEDLWGHKVVPKQVKRVYRCGDDKLDHVLIVTTTRSVFLVVVVDLVGDSVLGHHLLDLNDEYGLYTPQ